MIFFKDCTLSNIILTHNPSTCDVCGVITSLFCARRSVTESLQFFSSKAQIYVVFNKARRGREGEEGEECEEYECAAGKQQFGAASGQSERSDLALSAVLKPRAGAVRGAETRSWRCPRC